MPAGLGGCDGRDLAVDAERAEEIVLGSYGLSARDALHVAVTRHHDITEVMSVDAGFDRYPAVQRRG